MQGQLNHAKLQFQISTTCAHCNRPLHIAMDSDLHYTVEEPDAAPLVFVPMVDFDKLDDPSIIDAF